MINKIRNAFFSTWGLIVWIFEKSDIVPLLVIVSTFHYAGALSGKDPAPIAVVLGVLVDVGHYRSVKSAMKNQGKERFAVMTVLTAMTGYYHWLWYKDFLLAISLPTLIICLALLSKWDGWERQAIGSTVKTDKIAVKDDDKPSDNPVAPEQQELDTRGKLIEFYRKDPKGSLSDAGKAIGISRQRVGQLLKVLETNGTITRNGKVTVL
jgi:uncharacterized membrane protein (UPF0136 family)